MERPVERLCNSDASLTRCASPPESVVACCPSVTYPSPTSTNVSIYDEFLALFSKKLVASSAVIAKISAMFSTFIRDF